MIDEQILKEYNDVILDTGIYIEYFQPKENKLKKSIRELLFSEDSLITIHSHYLLKSEIYYIMCRYLGRKKAENLIKEIEDFINFISGDFLYQIAGQIKCEYPIALSDCYSIASGVIQDCPILFLKEKELSDEIVKKINDQFNSKIYLIPLD